MTSVNWNAVSAISSSVATLLVIIAAWIALRQFRESLSARQLQSILGLIQQLESSSARKTRSFLYQHKQDIEAVLAGPQPFPALDQFLSARAHTDRGPKSLADLRNDLAALEYAAVLGLHDMVPTKLELAYLVPTVIDYWAVIEPIVIATRKEINSEVYLQHFQSLFLLATSGELYGSRARSIKKQEVGRLINQSRATVVSRKKAEDPVPW